MSVYLWRVVAVKDTRDSKPNQKEILEAFNQRFGVGTAPNGTSLTNFQIEKV